MRAGGTLHETLVALTVSGIIAALAAAAGAGQLRFFRGIGEAAAVRTQVSQAALVTASVLRDVAGRRHILAASDSAIEVAVTTGTSSTCQGDTGRIVVALGAATANTLASFPERPAAGEPVEILTVDGSPGLLEARLAADPEAAACAVFPEADGWAFSLVEPFVVESGVPVRFTRRVRLSHYRASDGHWYLGYAEWNAASDRFNTVQPVAGPLLPRGGGAPGFQLEYREESGALVDPPDPGRIALITVIVRGDSRGPVNVDGMRIPDQPYLRDSAIVSVAVR